MCHAPANTAHVSVGVKVYVGGCLGVRMGARMQVDMGKCVSLAGHRWTRGRWECVSGQVWVVVSAPPGPSDVPGGGRWVSTGERAQKGLNSHSKSQASDIQISYLGPLARGIQAQHLLPEFHDR